MGIVDGPLCAEGKKGTIKELELVGSRLVGIAIVYQE